SAQYDGNTDVYLIPTSGGEPERLTWHPAADNVVGWTSNGRRVLFRSGRTNAPVPYPNFWTVGLDGGLPVELPIPRGFTGSYSGDGSRFAYQQIALNDAEWRSYRGGQTQPVWIVDTEDYALEEVPWDNTNDLDPVWLGEDVYFLSDRDWAMNLYAYSPATGATRQVTRHTDFDIKSLDAGGGVVVYEQGGLIHLHDPATGSTAPVEIGVRGDFPWLRPHWEDVGSTLQNASLSPTGVRALFEGRGDVFTVPTEDGDWRNLTRSPGVADRSPAWAPNGKLISWFSDAGGEYRLMIGTQEGLEEPRAIPIPNATFFFTPTWSPDSRFLAFTDTDLNLWYADVESGELTHVDTDQYAHPVRTVDPVWSPDSRWLAYAKRLDNQFHAIMVLSVEEGRTLRLTDGLSDAVAPAWDAGGKYLYFLASTDYALNTGWLDMTSYERPVRRALYLAVLQADEPSPFLPQSDEEEAEADVEAGPDGEGDPPGEADTVEDIRIDWEGIGQRILAADVPARDYAALAAGPEGVVFFGENVPNQPGVTLHRYDVSENEATSYLSPIQQFSVSADGEKLLYRSAAGWGVVATSGSPSVGEGAIQTDVRTRVDPRAEWRQMFREAWRYQRDFLYVENMHGADWDEIYRMYSPWVDDVAHRSDLNYLLDILGGEVAIGHSFVFGGDTPDVDNVSIGLLGADLEEEGGRYRIAHIYNGENWNPDLRAPL
ncbi:MAG: PDZ domain-containing protein, partial [Gemmatimonadota bacterium]|nr:PDZ domain-containing protein [Gemmatimonadota bacterium]